MSRSLRWAGSLALLLALAAPVLAGDPAALESPDAVDAESLTLVSQLLKMLAFLGGICALGWLSVKVLGPKLSPLAGRPGDLIHVVDMKRLDAKTALYVVEVGGKHALIAVSDHEVRSLSALDLDDDAIQDLAQKRDGGSTQKVKALGSFGQALSRGAAGGGGKEA